MSAIRLILVAAMSLTGTSYPLLAQNAATEEAVKDPSVPVDYYDGLRAWENGAEEVAISLWLRAAEYGDTRAMWKLSLQYELGTILPKEPYLATYYAALAERLEGKSFNKSIDSVDPEAGMEIRSAVLEFVPKVSPAVARWVIKPDPVDALVQAIYGGTEADVIRAVQAVPTVKPVSDKAAFPPVFHAAAAGRADAVKAILTPMTWISDLRALTKDGLTVLHFAAMSGSESTVRALYEGGAVAFAESPKGLLPSAVADSAGFKEVADLLRGYERVELRMIQENLNRLGYDVGAPDGVIGPRTRMQMAIAANGLGLSSDVITPEIARAVAFMIPFDVWGAALTVEMKDRSGRYILAYPSLTAHSAKEAKERALLLCKYYKDAENCEVQAVFPRGACMALAKSTKVREWSRAFASEAVAKQDALSQCANASGGDNCEILQSFCVRRD